MDTLTHALSGALLARATAPRQARTDQLPPRLRTWVGFWAAMFPDSDFVLRFIDPLTYLTLHRGVTHSVILLPLWAVGLAFLFMYIVRRRYSWRAFVGVCALGIGIHILGDVITAFGTIVFAPFSGWRAQIPTTFIIDPYFTGIIALGLIASAFIKPPRAAARAALIVLAALVGFQWTQHRRAIAFGEAYAAAAKLDAASVHAIPQPFSPFHWMVVIEQPRGYRLAHVSLTRDEPPPALPADANWLLRVNASYQPTENAMWQTFSRFGDTDAGLAQEAWNAPVLARYRHFALFPTLLRIDRTGERTCVWFDDLRFNLVGRHTPFRFGACRDDPSAAWKVYQLTSDDHGTEILNAIPE
jgi:inner membrane protein